MLNICESESSSERRGAKIFNIFAVFGVMMHLICIFYAFVCRIHRIECISGMYLMADALHGKRDDDTHLLYYLAFTTRKQSCIARAYSKRSFRAMLWCKILLCLGCHIAAMLVPYFWNGITYTSHWGLVIFGGRTNFILKCHILCAQIPM